MENAGGKAVLMSSIDAKEPPEPSIILLFVKHKGCESNAALYYGDELLHMYLHLKIHLCFSIRKDILMVLNDLT